MIRTVNIITAVYIGDPVEYGYEKGKTYPLKLSQDDQFPIVLTGLKEFSTEEDVTKQRLVYSNLNNMLGHWDEIRDTMGTFTEGTLSWRSIHVCWPISSTCFSGFEIPHPMRNSARPLSCALFMFLL
jgi:hypothetical protein